MRVLSMGLPFGTPGEPIKHFRSARHHVIRTLAADGPADFSFAPHDTAADVVARVARRWRADALLCWCPERYPPPREIEHCPIKTVAVVSDWTVYFPQLEHNLGRFDLVVADRAAAGGLRAPGVTPRYVMPVYSQRTGVHRELGIERDIDIAFAGNLNRAVHVRRGRLIERIAALSERYRVAIASGLDDAAYTQLLNRTRIAFNCTLRGEMNLRCFEAIACGALLFVEAENLEAQEMLRDRQEVVLYRDETLVQLIEEYLERPAECRRVAANGLARSRAIAGEQRLDALLDWVAAQSMGTRPARAMASRDNLLAEIMMYFSSASAGQRALAEELLVAGLKQYPSDAAFMAAKGCAALDRLAGAGPDARKPLVAEVRQAFGWAASAAPASAPLWLNLAFISRHAKAAGAEGHFLRLALNAESAVYGGLLAGERRDPYYARWRTALATGTANVRLLHAAAKARLAALALDTGDVGAACALARESIGLEPEVDVPYRILAAAEERAENLHAAAEVLEGSLPLTALDSAHREALIRIWEAVGRSADARALAAQSAAIFGAWWGAEPVAESFRTTAQRLA